MELAEAAYDHKEQELGPDLMRRLERVWMLNVMDRLWIQHLTAIDDLREGIGLRAYGQRDPLIEYKVEAARMFDDLQATIRTEVVNTIYHLQVTQQAPPAPPTQGAFESGPDKGDDSTTPAGNGAPSPTSRARRAPPLRASPSRRQQGRSQRSVPVRLGQEVQALPGRMNGTQLLRDLQAAVEQVLVGKTAEVELAIIGLAANGHLLIEDVPGVGKTMLAKSLARAIGCTFKRIQFTPDLLPSDVTGVSIYNQRSGEFEFRPGPIVAQVVLADEINRATPKTQSALLEAMEEQQVTVDGMTRRCRRRSSCWRRRTRSSTRARFRCPRRSSTASCCASTSAIPSRRRRRQSCERQMLRHPIEDLRAVTSASELQQVQQAVRGVHVDAGIQRYIVHVVGLTRDHPDVYLGASPRGSLALMRASQARAMLQAATTSSPTTSKPSPRPRWPTA